MIESLIERVWKNPLLTDGLLKLERDWISRSTGADAVGERFEVSAGPRYLEAAAILACSSDARHRLAAYRIATYSHDLFRQQIDGIDAAVRVVLTRLGNFPGLATSDAINQAGGALPLALAGEEISRREANQVLVGQRALVLTDYQRSLWAMLSEGSSVAIAAPTSAGKSFVLQAFIAQRLTRKPTFSACYIVPTRALIAQVQADLTEALAEHSIAGVEIVTVPLEADEPLPDQAVYVLTQERLQILLLNHPEKSFEFIVVDEAHSVQDGDRGIILQTVVDELVIRNDKVQLLFASPTVENLDVFGAMVGKESIKSNRTDQVTVSQNFIDVEITARKPGTAKIFSRESNRRSEVGDFKFGHSLTSRVECLVHVAHQLGAERQSIVYADGQADAEKIAFQISDLRGEGETFSSPALSELSELAKEAVHPKYLLASTIMNGVGFHYGNIPTILRNAVEAAFDDGHLHYLVCTSTLLAGVNLPAKNLFMCLPNRKKGEPLESVDFWNLAGRAGRLRREFQGNIFLIDYNNWKKHPLEGPRSAPITPAMQKVIAERFDDLDAVIRNDRFVLDKVSDSGLETIFVRLLADYKRGRLDATLKRAVPEDSDRRANLEGSLAVADAAVTLSADIIAACPTISAHRQQKLFDGFMAKISEQGEAGAKSLLIKHPREADAFGSYVAVLERCHGVLIDRPGSVPQNRFFALMLLQWMQGISISEMVDNRIAYKPTESVNTSIRATLDLVEKELRFNYVRILGCYTALLSEAYRQSNFEALIQSIPSISLYLEIGASDKTMISFVSMGLSRLVAKKLNELCPNKALGVTEAMQWLKRQNLDAMGLSPYLQREVLSVMAGAAA